MASLSYDLIVLGDDFAGLVAATLCASRGMRVLLAEASKTTASYRLEKETVPRGSFVLSGLQRPGCQRVLSELNFEHLMRRKLGVRETPFQLLGPRLRLELHPEEGQLAAAMAREASGTPGWLRASEDAQAPLDELLSEGICIPGTGFWERRELGKRLPVGIAAAESWDESEHSGSEEFLAELCHLACGAAGETLAKSRSVANALQGLPRLAGGTAAWRELFLEKFQAHSGERRVCVPEAIDTSFRKVTGLRSLDDEFRCDHLIAAMPAQELAPLLTEKAQKKLRAQTPFPSVAAYEYTVNLIVHTSALPEGLSDLAASMLDPSESPLGGNYALFSTQPAERPGRAILSISGYAGAQEDGEPELEGMQAALTRHAQERMPFLQEHIEVIDSPHEPAAARVSRDLSEPLPPKPVWTSPADSSLGLEVLPYASGIKQLWLASAQTLPGLGLEGQFIAAHGVSKLASAGASKGKGSKPSVLAAAGQ